VSGDGRRPIVEAFACEFLPEFDDPIDSGLRQQGRAVVWAAGPRLVRGLAFDALGGHQARGPAVGEPIFAGHLRLATALNGDSGDDKASFRCQPTVTLCWCLADAGSTTTNAHSATPCAASRHLLRPAPASSASTNTTG
jgi:hypothetical protein